MQWRVLAGIGLLPLLVSCNSKPEIKTLGELAAELRDSVVQISYSDAAGHATGFFVPSDEGCRVLTVAHAVPENRKVQITTSPHQTLIQHVQIQRVEDADLAIIEFTPESNSFCPYSPLKLEDSNAISIGEQVLLIGYPTRAGAARLVMQFPDGKISSLESPPLPEGYAVSYNVLTAGGMSGSPVVNQYGQVVAVHGMTDSELVGLARSRQSSLSPEQIERIEEREEYSLQRVNHFKWGIPIEAYANYNFKEENLMKEEFIESVTNDERQTINSSKTTTSQSVEATSTPFRDGVNSATKAATLAQIASSSEDWNTVAEHWNDAVKGMQLVPRDHSRYDVAQTKVSEFQKNLDYARRLAEQEGKKAYLDDKTNAYSGEVTIPATESNNSELVPNRGEKSWDEEANSAQQETPKITENSFSAPDPPLTQVEEAPSDWSEDPWIEEAPSDWSEAPSITVDDFPEPDLPPVYEELIPQGTSPTPAEVDALYEDV